MRVIIFPNMTFPTGYKTVNSSTQFSANEIFYEEDEDLELLELQNNHAVQTKLRQGELTINSEEERSPSDKSSV